MSGIAVLLPRLAAAGGLGDLFFGSSIASYKCFFWLHTGAWRSIDIRSGLLWLGLDPGATGERGLDQILSWLYGQSLEVALMLGGLVIFAVSMQYLDANHRRDPASTRPQPRNRKTLPPPTVSA